MKTVEDVKMQNFNEFLGRKVPLSISVSLSCLLSNKCSQQETSDGFHVQKDKFSSVCINYVSFLFLRDAERESNGEVV
jgi:hypothetical protein